MEIKLTKHFIKRFRERVARTSRIYQFAERAFWNGQSIDNIKNKELLFSLTNGEVAYGSSARIYQNFVYWFYQDRAVTVYRLPRQFQGKA